MIDIEIRDSKIELNATHGYFSTQVDIIKGQLKTLLREELIKPATCEAFEKELDRLLVYYNRIEIVGNKLLTEVERNSNKNDNVEKALEYAIDVIQTVAKMSDKTSKEYGETLIEQIDNIQAYCWQEGYILTHKEELKQAIANKGDKK